MHLKGLVNLVGETDLIDFSREMYKAYSCGPTIGCCINGEWVYADELPQDDLVHIAVRGDWVTGISVSSSVEGSDVEVAGKCFMTSVNEFTWENACQDVDAEAEFYWKRDNSVTFEVRRTDDARIGPFLGYLEAGCRHPRWDPEMPKYLRPLVKNIIDDWPNNTEIEPTNVNISGTWEVSGICVDDVF